MSTRSPYRIETSGERDILTSVPPEILVKIITLVPSKHYLDLVHTTKALRNFIKLNASSICNEAIRSRFPVEAKVLQSEPEAGWLVPTHEKVAEEEECFRQKLNAIRPSNNEQEFSLLGKLPTESTLSIKITSPGPQYLHFLEHNILQLFTQAEIGKYWRITDKRWPATYVWLKEIREVVVDGRKHFFGFRHHPFGELAEPFSSFMRSFNKLLVEAKNGELVRRDYAWTRTRFPRELVWFYGVERLRIVKEGEVADWKTLPMLLWQ